MKTYSCVYKTSPRIHIYVIHKVSLGTHTYAYKDKAEQVCEHNIGEQTLEPSKEAF